MAIVAIAAALLLWFISTRMRDGQVRLVLLVIAGAAVAFAAYLAFFNPTLAWDLQWVGRLITKIAGGAFRHML